MGFGICLLSIVPGRKEPSDKSEMITQVLFGETYEVLEITPKFVRICLTDDQYECWICIKQHQEISQIEFKDLKQQSNSYCYELLGILQSETNYFPIVMGSNLRKISSNPFKINNQVFSFEGKTTEGKEIVKSQIIEDAFMYLNAPYLWGGKSPLGIDCSGFTQIVYKINGINIPRDASQQVEMGEPYSFVEECEAGDLAFFDNPEGNIVHVGIVLAGGKIIHASGKVRVDKLDHYGIFNIETNKYSHKLRLIKKLV